MTKFEKISGLFILGIGLIVIGSLMPVLSSFPGLKIFISLSGVLIFAEGIYSSLLCFGVFGKHHAVHLR